MSKWLVLAALLPAAAGCAGGSRFQGGPHVTSVSATELPPPERGDLAAGGRPYYLGPYDKVEIDVFGVPELRRQVQVDAGGNVSFPLVGVVQAGGRTPGELAVAIQERLQGNYVRNPQVSVNLLETVSQVVTVDGQVENPGLFPVIGRMTLERAVARAGGVTEYARLSDVVVFRTVGGQQYAGLYNLDAIRRGAYPDPEIYASDVIIVGDSPARRLFRDILQAAPLLTTPLIILTNRN